MKAACLMVLYPLVVKHGNGKSKIEIGRIFEVSTVSNHLEMVGFSPRCKLFPWDDWDQVPHTSRCETPEIAHTMRYQWYLGRQKQWSQVSAYDFYVFFLGCFIMTPILGNHQLPMWWPPVHCQDLYIPSDRKPSCGFLEKWMIHIMVRQIIRQIISFGFEKFLTSCMIFSPSPCGLSIKAGHHRQAS